MSTAREAIKAKIQKLLAMTAENGASEAEAMHAARKAGELMAEYDLTFGDVQEVRDDRYGARKRPFAGGSLRRRTHHESSWCHNAIAGYCGVRCYYSGMDLIYFGTDRDTELAHYLSDVIRAAMDSEAARYLKSPDRPRHLHGKSLRADFTKGMISRINERLREMTAAKKADIDAAVKASGSTGTALAVLEKGKVVAERFERYKAQHGLNIKTMTSSSRSYRSAEAVRSGMAAGDRVSLNPGLSQSSQGAIGRR